MLDCMDERPDDETYDVDVEAWIQAFAIAFFVLFAALVADALLPG